MNKYFLLAGVLLTEADVRAYGQELPAIQTDRPDQTECPFIVPQYHFQMENGFSFEHQNKNNNLYLLPSSLMRYGINDKYELRLIAEFAQIKSGDQDISGLTPVTAGIKVNLAQEKGLLPVTSFIGHLTIPKLAAEEFKATYYAPSFRFTMQHTLSKKMTLAYNIGAEWDGETPEPSFLYTLTTGYSITNNLGCYLELFGFAPQSSRSSHQVDCGFTYLLRNNVSVDFSGGYKVSENAPEYFVAAGFSFRLKD